MTSSPAGQDLHQVIESLRARGVDVIRVSYPDLIGTDRGRDVLIDELPTAMEHGLAFCRAVFHTSPRGDVVPVQGGLEDGLPDVKVVPDLGTLTSLPWEPGAAWCLGNTFDHAGNPAAESPRHVARAVADRLAELGFTAVIGPELEFFLCEPDGSRDAGWKRYANEPGNVYVVGRKGDPRGVLVAMLRYPQIRVPQVPQHGDQDAAGIALTADHVDIAWLIRVPLPACVAGPVRLAQEELQFRADHRGEAEFSQPVGDRPGDVPG